MSRPVNLASFVLLGLLTLNAAAQNSVAPPTPLRVVSVHYPKAARLFAVEATVELVATVGPRGEVQSIRVAKGHAILERDAKNSLSEWRFTPCPTGNCEAKVSFAFNLSGWCDEGDSSCQSETTEVELPGSVSVRSQHLRGTIH